jgi:beta-galactosidase
MKKQPFFRFFISIAMISFSTCCMAQKNTVLADQNFNEGWLFKKDTLPNGQSVTLEDSNWRKLNLPHDWAIEGPFSKKNDLRTGGLPDTGEAWYRKHFTVAKENQDKQVAIEFDGAMKNAKVWLNGIYIGERPYGYIGFEFDLTRHIKFGQDNIIAVQLSPEQQSARWYPGAGIYRNVRLKLNNPVHIPQWGTYITTPKVTAQKATVQIKTRIKNASKQDLIAVLETIVKDQKGKIIATKTSSVNSNKNTEKSINQQFEIIKPTIWDLKTPHLYTAISKVKIDNKIVDEFESEFGIRTIAFDADKGFFLNGNEVELNGVCLHHDQGALGSAVNYRAMERQMQIMQTMGVNALRTSHNPPAPELLKVCDKLGIVVIVEAFDEWQIGKVPNGYNKIFDQWHEKDLRDMIKRDRNHPSVIMWSIGNEILEQGKKDGWKITKELTDICHDEDNTRPTTAGFNYYPDPFDNKLADYVDVVGLNYWPLNYPEIKEKHPKMIIYGSETSSQTSSRGVYHFPLEAKEQRQTNHVSSYDVTVGPPWAYPPDVEFEAQEKSPFSLGEFIWTGMDYLGEPTPYAGDDNRTKGIWNSDWPSRSSYFAPVDLCGYPKDRYYLYQSQWTKAPMIHILPHWNWEGKEKEIIPIFCYTNCDEAELFVNGKSFGKKTKGKDMTKIPAEFHYFKLGEYASKYRLSWDVPYESGSIKVVGYKNGRAVTEKEIKTAGKPAKIALKADRTEIKANGTDLSYITVDIHDDKGIFCPTADTEVQFEISGEGTLAGLDNGNQTDTTSFQSNTKKAFNGKCLLIIKSTRKAGIVTVKATALGLISKNINIKTK